MADALRIPVKPQLWVWWLGVVVMPMLTALFGWLAVEDVEHRVAWALFTLVPFGLWFVAVAVLRRLRGRTLEIVVDDVVEVPAMFRDRVDRFAVADILTGNVTQMNASGVVYSTLFLKLRPEASGAGSKGRVVSVASQLVGPEAFRDLVQALVARGAPIR
ncbi:MAG: hypothetical protein H6733_12890 [Alphaproteobacteria bacterium]|nr:hypothetical protein [Alphaproteobacteria bacterium]